MTLHKSTWLTLLVFTLVGSVNSNVDPQLGEPERTIAMCVQYYGPGARNVINNVLHSYTDQINREGIPHRILESTLMYGIGRSAVPNGNLQEFSGYLNSPDFRRSIVEMARRMARRQARDEG